MKMNKALLGAVAAIAMVASSAMASQISVSRVPGYYSGSGGEFNLVPVSGSLVGVQANYSPLALVGNGFESFCLERGESVSIPGTYYYQVSPDAIKGGTTTSDPISVGTADLYSQFAQGALGGYAYGVGRSVSAGLLQEAIWWLEGELTLTLGQQAANLFIQAVLGTYGSEAGAKADNAGQYAVNAVNMGTTPDGNRGLWPVQDFLVYGNPCFPDGGTTVMLLGLALTGLVALQRKARA